MTVEKWPAALEADDVPVMTPQSLVNMLMAGVVDFNKICALVGHSNVILLFLPPVWPCDVVAGDVRYTRLCFKLYQPTWSSSIECNP